MQGFVAVFCRAHKAWCSIRALMLALMLLPVAVLPSMAQELARFSGIWVVDMKPTVEAWKRAGHPLDKATQNLLSAYRIRMDFTGNRLEKGIIVGDGAQKSRFEVARQEKDRYTLTIKSKTAKVFFWQVLDNERVIVSVKGEKEPPLYMVRENLVRLSGVWRLEDPVVACIALRKAGQADVGKEKERLADLRISVDFDAQELEWTSRSGQPVFEGPEGAFVVTGRVNGDFTLSFSQGAMLWHEDAKGRAVITVRDLSLTFVRDVPAKAAKL